MKAEDFSSLLEKVKDTDDFGKLAGSLTNRSDADYLNNVSALSVAIVHAKLSGKVVFDIVECLSFPDAQNKIVFEWLRSDIEKNAQEVFLLLHRVYLDELFGEDAFCACVAAAKQCIKVGPNTDADELVAIVHILDRFSEHVPSLESQKDRIMERALHLHETPDEIITFVRRLPGIWIRNYILVSYVDKVARPDNDFPFSVAIGLEILKEIFLIPGKDQPYGTIQAKYNIMQWLKRLIPQETLDYDTLKLLAQHVTDPSGTGEESAEVEALLINLASEYIVKNVYEAACFAYEFGSVYGSNNTIMFYINHKTDNGGLTIDEIYNLCKFTHEEDPTFPIYRATMEGVIAASGCPFTFEQAREAIKQQYITGLNQRALSTGTSGFSDNVIISIPL